MRATATVVGCLTAAALSILVVAPAPAYDAWAWLLWGREVAGGALHTAEGPAFKPLPVAVCALLAPFGGAAPVLWVIVARAGAVLAVVLAFRLGRRLAAEVDELRVPSDSGAGGDAQPRGATGVPLAAGLLAAAGTALCGAFLGYAAEGVVTGWLLAFGLAGLQAWCAGRPRLALACAVACCLLHVEAWPFAAAFGVLMWLRRPQDRPLLVAAVLAVPLLWIVPEWLGSGDPLRSGSRARIPNPGQPALADVPALASLRESARLVLWPLWMGLASVAAVAWSRRSTARPTGALALALVGAAWVLLVAIMAQLGGFSGEARYATPGAALIAIAGAVGLATGVGAISGRAIVRRERAAATRVELRPQYGRNSTHFAIAAWIGATVVALTLLIAAVARLNELSDVPAAQAHQWRLADDLQEAIEIAGGRAAVLRCGTPYVGPLRGPLLAYRLDVAKADVEPDLPPRRPGVVFRSAHRVGDRTTPAPAPVFAYVGRGGPWQVARACRVRKP